MNNDNDDWFGAYEPPEELQEQEEEQDYDRDELENRLDILWRQANDLN